MRRPAPATTASTSGRSPAQGPSSDGHDGRGIRTSRPASTTTPPPAPPSSHPTTRARSSSGGRDRMRPSAPPTTSSWLDRHGRPQRQRHRGPGLHHGRTFGRAPVLPQRPGRDGGLRRQPGGRDLRQRERRGDALRRRCSGVHGHGSPDLRPVQGHPAGRRQQRLHLRDHLSGTLVRTINAHDIPGLSRHLGLAMAPASDGSGVGTTGSSTARSTTTSAHRERREALRDLRPRPSRGTRRRS